MKNKFAFTLAEGATHINRQHNNRKNAFTLAEVLITLGIIGVVAAMTIPTLIHNQQEKATITSLKKFYSTVSQAYLFAYNEEGSPDNWGTTVTQTFTSKVIFDKFKPYLKTVKECEEGKCFDQNIDYKYMDGRSYTLNQDSLRAFQSFVLADGSIAFFEGLSPECTASFGEINDICFSAFVDVNGSKPPNTLGKDYFTFRFTKSGKVLPAGTEDFGDSELGFESACGPDKSGYGCTAWVIMNENLDYLHCPELLGWDKKSKCK